MKYIHLSIKYKLRFSSTSQPTHIRRVHEILVFKMEIIHIFVISRRQKYIGIEGGILSADQQALWRLDAPGKCVMDNNMHIFSFRWVFSSSMDRNINVKFTFRKLLYCHKNITSGSCCKRVAISRISKNQTQSCWMLDSYWLKIVFRLIFAIAIDCNIFFKYGSGYYNHAETLT